MDNLFVFRCLKDRSPCGSLVSGEYPEFRISGETEMLRETTGGLVLRAWSREFGFAGGGRVCEQESMTDGIIEVTA